MNERQKKILELYNLADDKDIIDYYGILQIVLNVEDKIENLDFISDKITLSQIANDFELASKLINASITDKKQKQLYFKLKETNVDIDETINIEMLSDKYSFMEDLLDSIITDIAVQQRLISLSDERLDLFKQLFIKVKDEVSNPVPIITKLLTRLGTSLNMSGLKKYNYYASLNSSIEKHLGQGIQLSELDKEKLLFIYTSNTNWAVSSIEDLTSFGEKDSKDMLEINEMVSNEKNSPIKNIDNIKNSLLKKSYGISLDSATNIVLKYKAGNIKITDDNRDTMRFIFKSL